MSEIIIERPRRGHRMGHFRRARRVDAKVLSRSEPELLLSRLGMQRGAKLGRSYKSLNENLAPLRRYLERQVNRPWDKVWSEISKNLAATSAVQQHVRDHVADFVATRTFLKDGAVYAADRYGRPIAISDGTLKLYVDPRSGLLRRNKHYRSWQTRAREDRAAAESHRAARMRVISPTVQAHKLDDGCWWEVTLAPIPTRIVTHPSNRRWVEIEKYTDVVKEARLSRFRLAELYGREDVYAVAKRQLSRREIIDLALK